MAKRGRATIAIVTTAFTTLAHAQASALGNPGLPIAVIPHPLGVRTRGQLREIAEQHIEEIVKLASEGTAK